jgi:hypothetical protein
MCECAGACAIVGYHGAGHTNAMFSRNNTYVLEVSTFEKPGDNTSIWRSNRQNTVMKMDNTVVWEVYPIELECLRPTLNLTFYNSSSAGNTRVVEP